MAVEHKNLTGDQLHEPKGAETAAAGSVYVADGAGSGTWSDPVESINNINLFSMEQRFDDLGTAGSIIFNVPYKSELKAVNILLYGAIDVDTAITVYINGVLFADSLIIAAAGTTAGQKKTLAVTTPHSIPAGSIVSITSDGASTVVTKAEVQLELEATS
jgi:hypothetical protein